jgi:hypothetical protein
VTRSTGSETQVSAAIGALGELVSELEADRSWSEPDRFRERVKAIDRLDVYPLEEFLSGECAPSDADICHRAKAIYAGLEATNVEFCDAIREQIRGGERDSLLRLAGHESGGAGTSSVAAGDHYDYLDELVSGVLRFAEPDAGIGALAADMVFYQPTPARHIFDFIARARITERDVMIDLGSGLGHVPLLVSICTDARGVGIEVEPGYADCARQSASELNLSNVTFLRQDARDADLSSGTVFFLYTPFVGGILRDVLGELRRVASDHDLRVCTFGPCTEAVGKEPWLERVGDVETGRIAVFRSANPAREPAIL